MDVKKGALLLLILALSAGLLAGCQPKNTALETEVTTLYATMKADYDAIVSSLEAAGALTADGVKEIVDGVSAEVEAIGARIENGQVARLTQQELETLKEELSSVGEVLSGVATFASEELEGLLGGLEETLQVALKGAEQELEALGQRLAALGEKADAALTTEYEVLQSEIAALLKEAEQSEAAAWTQAQAEKLEERLDAALEALGAYAEKLAEAL